MSRMSELDHDLQTISGIMADPVLSAEEQVEAKVDWIVRQMDELCALANNAETRDLIATQSIGIGQIQFRASLILSFLGKPALRVVSNVR